MYRILTSKEILLLFCSTILGLFLAECGLRIYAHYSNNGNVSCWRIHEYEKMIYEPLPYMMFGLKPLSTGKTGRWKINSLGFRGKEIPIEKPQGVFRIVAMGGSTTFGYCIENEEDTYPAILERLLNNVYKGNPKIEVINAGVSGYMSAESLINFQMRILDLKPDGIILYHGINDLRARMVPNFKGDYSHHRVVWSGLRERSTYFSKLIEKSYILRVLRWKFTSYRSRGDLLLLVRNSPPRSNQAQRVNYINSSVQPFIRNMRNIIKLAKSYDIKVLLLTFAYNKAMLESHSHWHEGLIEQNNALCELAESEQVPIVKLDSLMPQDPQFWCDSDQVTVAGAKVRSKIIFNRINKLNWLKKD